MERLENNGYIYKLVLKLYLTIQNFAYLQLTTCFTASVHGLCLSSNCGFWPITGKG